MPIASGLLDNVVIVQMNQVWLFVLVGVGGFVLGGVAASVWWMWSDTRRRQTEWELAQRRERTKNGMF